MFKKHEMRNLLIEGECAPVIRATWSHTGELVTHLNIDFCSFLFRARVDFPSIVII